MCMQSFVVLCIKKALGIFRELIPTTRTRKSCTGQVLPSEKYRPTCLVVDVRCDILERADTAVTKLQISPLIVNGFKNGFHQWIQRIFLVVVEAKKFFSEIFFWKFGCTLPPCLC